MHQLQFKPLIQLWDKSVYTNSSEKQKAYDGQFAIKALFSVEAFSTNPKTANPTFCRDALELFLQEIREVRANILTQHTTTKNEWGDITLVPFVSEKHRHDMTIDNKHLCRSTGVLLKTFLSANDYLLDLHRAQINEELSDRDFMDARAMLLKSMNGLIHRIATMNRVFHIERKKLEGVNGLITSCQ
ncbi:hypothetical protein [Vibrio splendidus]|uniref:DUF1845 domain-containing protein n=1 Tax=Vibrio splendidus TaxID=29497 RepID=A0A2N7JKS5_VIBSP|nr:hypothetical protein [Vibrio splendidus]PMM41604.1 hypothetical protein BCT54_10260 [Vibrio splendidus]